MPETLDNSAWVNEASKPPETLQNDRSGNHKPLEEVSRSDMRYSLLDLQITESPNRPLSPKASQPVDDDLAVVTPQEWTRSDVQSPAMNTQVIESPKALPITCNESLSKNGAPPLAGNPQLVRPLSICTSN
jgi:hypothetical protein